MNRNCALKHGLWIWRTVSSLLLILFLIYIVYTCDVQHHCSQMVNTGPLFALSCVVIAYFTARQLSASLQAYPT